MLHDHHQITLCITIATQIPMVDVKISLINIYWIVYPFFNMSVCMLCIHFFCYSVFFIDVCPHFGVSLTNKVVIFCNFFVQAQ
ncbi:hypothetical protein FKM82_027447 [Ascaphus truei]